MREAGLTQAQAEAIAAFPEERLVTREYLDARLAAFRGELTNELTWRLLGIVSLAILLVTLIDKFVRP